MEKRIRYWIKHVLDGHNFFWQFVSYQYIGVNFSCKSHCQLKYLALVTYHYRQCWIPIQKNNVFIGVHLWWKEDVLEQKNGSIWEEICASMLVIKYYILKRLSSNFRLTLFKFEGMVHAYKLVLKDPRKGEKKKLKNSAQRCWYRGDCTGSMILHSLFAVRFHQSIKHTGKPTWLKTHTLWKMWNIECLLGILKYV